MIKREKKSCFLIRAQPIVADVFLGLYLPLFQASRIIQKLISPDAEQDVSNPQNEVIYLSEEKSKLELSCPFTLVDYSNLFGEEFRMLDEHWDCSYLNILDMRALEEGILHVLYSCASQVPYSKMLYNSLVPYLSLNFCCILCTLFNTVLYSPFFAARWLGELQTFGPHCHLYKLCFQVLMNCSWG